MKKRERWWLVVRVWRESGRQEMSITTTRDKGQALEWVRHMKTMAGTMSVHFGEMLKMWDSPIRNMDTMLCGDPKPDYPKVSG